MKHLVRGQGFGAIVGVVLMLAAFSLIDFNGWWTAQTLSNVIQFTAILGLVAMGQALVIMSKEIDLSVGSIYGLTAVTFIMMTPDLGVVGAVVVSLLVACAAGFLQGLAVVKGQLPSMLVTLGGLFAARGIIYIWTGGSIRSFSEDARQHFLTRLFGGELFGIAAAIYWLALVVIVLTIVLWQPVAGNRWIAGECRVTRGAHR